MYLYLVTYDLLDGSRDYSEFYNGIKSLGDVRHPLENVWFVSSGVHNVDSIYRMLKPRIDERDRLLCIRVSSNAIQGWVGKSFWDWIKTIRQE